MNEVLQKDKRGYEYSIILEENIEDEIFIVSIESFEGHNLHCEVSKEAYEKLLDGDCEYPLDVDEWDIWMDELERECTEYIHNNYGRC